MAMSQIAALFANGQGVTQDYQKAMEWYLKASDKGVASAMTEIGSLYANGQGVKQDKKKAMEWYLKAADKDEAGAMYGIGVLYDSGEGVTQDYQKAMEWYLKAADKGEAGAMNNIGTLYDKGKGVKQDSEKAMEWFLKAADKGEVIAINNIGVLYHNGQVIEKYRDRAIEWHAKAEAQKKQERDEQVKEADNWKKINCGGAIYNLQQLLMQNPYDIGGKCFFLDTFQAADIQILSRTVALFTYRLMEKNYVVYTDFGDASAPVGQWRTFVVKGNSEPFKYTSVFGGAVTASKVHVLQEVYREK
ncbi:MAG: tetratricopeptide repeat protein, partial [Syntrophales bacterium]